MPMVQNESNSESRLGRGTDARLAASPDAAAQQKRMLIALGVLLLALGAVIVRDWDFWFPPRGETPEAAALRKSKSVAAGTTSAPAATNHEPKPTNPTTPAETQAPMSATAERAVLPPLEVEVVAGNRHVSVPAKSNAINLDVASGATASGSSGAVVPGSGAGPATRNATVNAAGRVRLSAQTQQSVSAPVPPDYPMLARQMKVQGAVTLQALIARDGTIQELRVLSGPEILATAAREAVKQWHFKPYMQNGQPVETQARITVNFTISTN